MKCVTTRRQFPEPRTNAQCARCLKPTTAVAQINGTMTATPFAKPHSKFK